MYDLVKIGDNQNDILRQLGKYAEDVLGEIQIEQTPSGYTATVPRQALVAIGLK